MSTVSEYMRCMYPYSFLYLSKIIKYTIISLDLKQSIIPQSIIPRKGGDPHNQASDVALAFKIRTLGIRSDLKVRQTQLTPDFALIGREQFPRCGIWESRPK